MENLVARVPLQDLRIVVTAILIQKESGGNLAEVLDFAHPNPSVPALPSPILPIFNTCRLPGLPQQETQWTDLLSFALLHGWSL